MRLRVYSNITPQTQKKGCARFLVDFSRRVFKNGSFFFHIDLVFRISAHFFGGCARDVRRMCAGCAQGVRGCVPESP